MVKILIKYCCWWVTSQPTFNLAQTRGLSELSSLQLGVAKRAGLTHHWKTG